ncbi:hypothetical protein DOJK_01964 [Patescibacteria group bacterium]|nr:hypothetical protein [Candidatus Dojkabacteria bacterium]CAG1022889.1 hypothetical protein DOJK_01964 [Patescibacteria group bacterium]
MNNINLEISSSELKFSKEISISEALKIISYVLNLSDLDDVQIPKNHLKENQVSKPVIEAKIKRVSTFKKPARSELNPQIEKIALTGTISNEYPTFNKMVIGGDKILWVLLYLKTHGISGASLKDIEYVSLKLGQVIRSKFFTALNKRNIIDGKVANLNGLFVIQQRGEEYLKSLLK